MKVIIKKSDEVDIKNYHDLLVKAGYTTNSRVFSESNIPEIKISSDWVKVDQRRQSKREKEIMESKTNSFRVAFDSKKNCFCFEIYFLQHHGRNNFLQLTFSLERKNENSIFDEDILTEDQLTIKTIGFKVNAPKGKIDKRNQENESSSSPKTKKKRIHKRTSSMEDY